MKELRIMQKADQVKRKRAVRFQAERVRRAESRKDRWLGDRRGTS